MREKKRVLVFPCGSEIGLEVYRSLRFSKDFEVYGASSVDDHGKYVFENYISDIPHVDDEAFVGSLAKIVDDYAFDFIFPAHDSVVLRFAQNRERINSFVVTSSAKTCEIARSKRATYKELRGIVTVPHEYTAADITEYPVFLKPDVGQGSKGTYKAMNAGDVEFYVRKDPSLMILEYLPGEEYTVDCFTDKDGNLLYAGARVRARTSNGISMNSKPVSGQEFHEIAQRINNRIEFRGVWFFQLKRNSEDQLVLLEIAPRIAGTMAVSRMKGANLALLSLYDAMGLGVSIITNDFDPEVDRALHSRYRLPVKFNTVYIDFDDTILLGGKINYLLIALIYKFREAGKKIILITKHIHVIEDTLKEHKITESIFDEIIVLKAEDKKSLHIESEAIFIDDSFAERMSVLEYNKIPVFDISEAVELL